MRTAPLGRMRARRLGGLCLAILVAATLVVGCGGGGGRSFTLPSNATLPNGGGGGGGGGGSFTLPSNATRPNGGGGGGGGQTTTETVSPAPETQKSQKQED